MVYQPQMEYYVKQNFKIIKSMVANIDKLAQETADYIAAMESLPAILWTADQDSARIPSDIGPIWRIVREQVHQDTEDVDTWEIHCHTGMILPGEHFSYLEKKINSGSFQVIGHAAKIQVSMMLHKIVFPVPDEIPEPYNGKVKIATSGQA